MQLLQTGREINTISGAHEALGAGRQLDEPDNCPTRHLSSLTCVQAFCDGGGVDEEATAQTTTNVGIELIEGDLRLQEGRV